MAKRKNSSYNCGFRLSKIKKFASPFLQDVTPAFAVWIRSLGGLSKDFLQYWHGCVFSLLALLFLAREDLEDLDLLVMLLLFSRLVTESLWKRDMCFERDFKLTNCEQILHCVLDGSWNEDNLAQNH